MTGRRFPWFGWVGLAWMAAVQILLAGDFPLVATWLTPWMWTGYFLAADGAVHALGGRSWLLDRRRELPLLILASVAIWLVFEAYNLHLRNWTYLGLPEAVWVRDLGYFWSFATIIPGVFVSASLIESAVLRPRPAPPASTADLTPGQQALAFIAGAAMIAIPLAAPPDVAAYLFALVWIGFVPLLDPLNRRLGGESLWARWRAGDRRPAFTLLTGGLACGFLWELWNLQALRAGGAYWAYLIPEPLRIFDLHFGQMPLLGLLGFPPFALELFVMYQFVRQALGGDRIFGPKSPR
jgi:hypothetical protein